MAEYFEYDNYEDIPEIDLTITVQPYMYEPLRKTTGNPDSSDSSDSESSDSSDDRSNNVDILPLEDWCSCGNCVIMATPAECRCCLSNPLIVDAAEVAGVKCITEAECFILNCLSHHVLRLDYYEHRQEYGPLRENEPIHELYRHLAYRRFVRWIWEYLGKRNRRILPACVVKKISEQFPSQQYCGFRYPGQ